MCLTLLGLFSQHVIQQYAQNDVSWQQNVKTNKQSVNYYDISLCRSFTMAKRKAVSPGAVRTMASFTDNVKLSKHTQSSTPAKTFDGRRTMGTLRLVGWIEHWLVTLAKTAEIIRSLQIKDRPALAVRKLLMETSPRKPLDWFERNLVQIIRTTEFW